MKCEARDGFDAVAVCVSKPRSATLLKDYHDFYTSTLSTHQRSTTRHHYTLIQSLLRQERRLLWQHLRSTLADLNEFADLLGGGAGANDCHQALRPTTHQRKAPTGTTIYRRRDCGTNTELRRGKSASAENDHQSGCQCCLFT